MAELLVEIGVEEMPAPWLPGLASELRSGFTRSADKGHLEPDAVETFWTPRRLVLRADVAERQPDREEQVWGPSLEVAKDAAGKWTGAARGFARKNGVDLEALQEAPRNPSKPEETHLLFVRRIAGSAAGEVLPEVLASTLRGLAFPKRMSWDAWLDDGRGAFPFGRPIRWMVVLLDGQVVPFTIHGLVDGARGAPIVESGSTTRGHRFLPRELAGQPLAVTSFGDLKDGLRRRFVLVDPEERQARVDEGLREVAGGAEVDDHGLRREWRDLVEYPTVVAGEVPDEFRSLPLEVLETVLRHHQKYVPLRDGRRSGGALRRGGQRGRSVGPGDRAGHGASGGGPAPGRGLLPERGPQADPRESHRRPRRRHVPPGARDLPGQGGADGPARSRRWGSAGCSTPPPWRRRRRRPGWPRPISPP